MLDIEGTTTSIRFMKEVLFPYIKKNLARYLRERWQSDEVVATLARLIRQEEKDLNGGLHPPKIWKQTETNDLTKIIESIVGNVVWQMDNKRNNTALKQLQILVWVFAYEKDELRGHVYSDVLLAFRRWRSMGIRLFVYSTGMAVAQQLLFSNSNQGNLLNMVENYFDSLTGLKTNPNTFRKIAGQCMNISTSQLLFITDTLEEAQAAREAGCQVIIIQRPDGHLLPRDRVLEYYNVSSLNEIEFQ